jgi:threonine dehydrogenase-like Zn-dependent dehydrogenase
MRAAAWTADRTLSIVERPEPAAQPGSTIVRVAACGICGSDLHFYRGEFQPVPGMVPGHEIAGVVESGGDLPPGTPIAVEPLLGCRTCSHCQAGNPMLCPTHRLMGMALPGGMQEALSVPSAYLHPLPPGVTPELGSLAEPLAVCVRAINLAQVSPGGRVLILGSGTIGLLSLLLARAVASEVAITARYPHQAALATRFGASIILEPGSSEFRSWAKSHRPDVVIETVGGTADTLTDAVLSVRGGGTVVVLGVFSATPSLPALQLVGQEVRVVGSLMYGSTGGRSEFGAAVDLLAGYCEELGLLQTAMLPLERANEAFEMAADKTRGAFKVTVLPGH